jgi:hypothetical protein
MRKIFCLSLLLALFLACAKNDDGDDPPPPPPQEKDVVDLFPADNEISGWTRYSTMRTASNETELEAMIDGAAPIFINRGFVKGADQKYVGDVLGVTDTLTLFICDMDDTLGADGVYEDIPHEMHTPWDSTSPPWPGREARIDENLLFAWDIEFWGDKFYCEVTIKDENKTDASKNVAKLFCLNVSQAIYDTTAFYHRASHGTHNP